MNRRDRKLWAAATTLADLGGLMATWLEGVLQSRPGGGGPADLGTPELAHLCATLCRGGVVTWQSQAGQIWPQRGTTMRARLFVEAFTDAHGLSRLQRACEDSGLLLVERRTPAWTLFPPHRVVDPIPAVSSEDGFDYLEIGGPIDRGYVKAIWKGISRPAMREVLDAWQVTLIDPEWGRNDLVQDWLTHRWLGYPRSVTT